MTWVERCIYESSKYYVITGVSNTLQLKTNYPGYPDNDIGYAL